MKIVLCLILYLDVDLPSKEYLNAWTIVTFYNTSDVSVLEHKLNCLNRKWEPNDDVGSVCPRVWTLWLQRDECFVNNLHVRDKKNLFDVMARALLHLKSQHCCRSLLFWHRLFWRGGVVALAFIFRGVRPLGSFHF